MIIKITPQETSPEEISQALHMILDKTNTAHGHKLGVIDQGTIISVFDYSEVSKPVTMDVLHFIQTHSYYSVPGDYTLSMESFGNTVINGNISTSRFEMLLKSPKSMYVKTLGKIICYKEI